jgi:hypothetical protein
MRRLRQQEQLVDRADVDVLDAPEVHAEAKVAQHGERVLAGDEPGVTQDARGAEDLVVEGDGLVVEQRSAGVELVIDDLGITRCLKSLMISSSLLPSVVWFEI